MIKDAQNLESVHIWSISTVLKKMFYFNEHQQSLKTWQSLIADSNFKPETISILLHKLSMCQKWPCLLKVAKFANFDNFRKIPSLIKNSLSRIFWYNWIVDLKATPLIYLFSVKTFCFCFAIFSFHFKFGNQLLIFNRIISDHHWKLWSLITFIWAIRFS